MPLFDGRWHKANAPDLDGNGLPDDIKTMKATDLAITADGHQLLFAVHNWRFQEETSLVENLDQNHNTVDHDGDGMSTKFEKDWGLDPTNPYDAYLSMANDGLTNLEKAQNDLPLDVPVDATTYESVRGASWAEFDANHNPNLSTFEQDWDADGISNLDEMMTFGTDPRDATSEPTSAELAAAITSLEVTATTLMNNVELLPGGGGGGDGGGDGGLASVGGGGIWVVTSTKTNELSRTFKYSARIYGSWVPLVSTGTVIGGYTLGPTVWKRAYIDVNVYDVETEEEITTVNQTTGEAVVSHTDRKTVQDLVSTGPGGVETDFDVYTAPGENAPGGPTD